MTAVVRHSVSPPSIRPRCLSQVSEDGKEEGTYRSRYNLILEETGPWEGNIFLKDTEQRGTGLQNLFY